MKRLVLIDGNSLIHRAYHALPPLSTPSGEQVNAVYGFTTMLLRVLQELKPQYIAMTFDLPGPTFRHQQYTAYKANRPAADGDLQPQFDKVRDVVRAFNIPIFELSGYEADDLVGTLARQADELNEQTLDTLETVIVSGDLDTLQLVSEYTKVFTPRKGISDTMLYDITQVKQRYGFEPKQLVDFKGLKGDPSDNIPGVPGIGERTAQTLIQTYGSIEAIVQNLAFLSGRTKDVLSQNIEQAKLSKTLATIDRFAPIHLKLEETRVEDFDRKKVLEMFQRFGFRSLVQRLNEIFPADGATLAEEITGEVVSPEEKEVKTAYKIVEKEADIEALVSQLKKAGSFAFDTETTSWNPIEAKLVGSSYSWRSGEAFYVPHSEKALQTLKPVLEDETLKKIGHNIKFDALVLENHGVELKGITFDTLIGAWLLNPGAFSLGLKNVVFQELGIQMQDLTELIGKGKKQIPVSDVPLHDIANYACADADMAFRLKIALEKKLKTQKLLHVLERYEVPLIPVLAHMERSGVLVDCDFLQAMSEDLAKRLEAIVKKIYASVGHEFNLNSPKQLADVLFGELQLPTITKTKTGYSTDESVLSSLKDAHPAIPLLLKYRELSKLKSTYIDALPNMVDKNDRLHTSFNQTGASSGRLSSSDPNLQNIPIRTELGAKIRNAFIASRGSVILAADYSQIELRILAHLSQDKVLVSAFKHNEDIHTVTASTIYGVNKDTVTKDQRRVGKTVNFALMYGISAFGLSQQLGISRHEAQAFIERYFLTYQGVKAFFDQLLKKAYEDGFVETMSGRRRYISELKSTIPTIKRAGERMALNLPMQGTSADIIKLAMVAIDHYLAQNNLQTKMILQVHDELVFEVPEAELKVIAPRIKSFMANATHLSVPLVVELKVGKSWGETEPLS